jgi:hypothetical protein
MFSPIRRSEFMHNSKTTLLDLHAVALAFFTYAFSFLAYQHYD